MFYTDDPERDYDNYQDYLENQEELDEEENYEWDMADIMYDEQMMEENN